MQHAAVTPPSRFVVALVLLLAALSWPVEAIGGQLNLTWVDTSLDELGFSVERGVGIDGPFAVVATTDPGVTAYTDTTVADSTTYCYRVRSFNSIAYSEYSFTACGTTAPAALTVALHINQQVFALGDRFQLDVTITHGGSVTVADVYAGSVLPAEDPAVGCPEGDPVVYVADAVAGLNGLFFTCLSGEASSAVPVYHSVSVGELPDLIGTNFFSFDWPPTTPGDYTVFVILTKAGTSNVIAQGTTTVSYTP